MLSSENVQGRTREGPPPFIIIFFYFFASKLLLWISNQNKGSSDSQQLELKHQRAAAAAASSSASSPTCSARCCRSGHHQQTNKQIPSRSFSNVQNQHQGDEHATAAAAASCVHPLRRRRRLFPSPDGERLAKKECLAACWAGAPRWVGVSVNLYFSILLPVGGDRDARGGDRKVCDALWEFQKEKAFSASLFGSVAH